MELDQEYNVHGAKHPSGWNVLIWLA